MTLFESPFLLGFEPFERRLSRAAKSAGDWYPPYNIEAEGEDRLRITVAVAGFTRGDLDVTVDDNQLVIRGRQRADDRRDRTYLHRGIAARQFERAFVLADGIDVTAARLEDGLLHVELERPRHEPAARRIDITAPRRAGGEALEPRKTGQEA